MESDDKDFEQASIAASDHDHLVRVEQRVEDHTVRLNAHQGYITGIATAGVSILAFMTLIIYYLVLPPINIQMADIKQDNDRLDNQLSVIMRDQANADRMRAELQKDLEQIRTDLNLHRKQTEKGQ